MDLSAMTLSDLRALSESFDNEIGRIAVVMDKAKRQRREVNEEIDKRTYVPPEPRVSDHALLRYIERVHGVDLDALRETILTPERAEYIKGGASCIKVDGMRFQVRDNTITTVITK